MQPSLDGLLVLRRDLQHQTQFLVEQVSDGVVLETDQVDVGAVAARDGHLDKGDNEATIAAIMQRLDQTLTDEVLDHLEGASQHVGVLDVRALVTELLEGIEA